MNWVWIPIGFLFSVVVFLIIAYLVSDGDFDE